MATTKEVQQKLFEMLCDIDSICRAHDIPYFLVEGSALGAVRHGGFIPWDDDLDVAMCREDTFRFQKVIEEEYKDRYFYQTPFNEPGYQAPFDKLRLNGTTFIEEGSKGWDCHKGLFVDIFPLDQVPPGRAANFRMKIDHMLFEAVVRNQVSSNPIKNLFVKLFAGPGSREQRLARLYRRITRYNGKGTGYFTPGYIAPYTRQAPMPRELFLPPRPIVYEGLPVFVPNQVETYLQNAYGEYMTLPPVSEQVGSHGVIIDLTQNYTEYQNGNQ